MISRRRVSIAGQWIVLGGVVGVVCGIASAIFLVALERVTHFRTGHELIVYSLPIAGLVIGAFYEWLGAPIKGGYNLVLDTLHTDGKQVPLRMAPMVLVGTVLTHLFGGSAGREGTAVQMGSSLADGVAHALKLQGHARRQVLAAGIAGGFGSVFGTPIAGTFFGLEVIRVGRIEYDALLPSLVAAVIGDVTTRALGVKHTLYPMLAPLDMTPTIFGKWIVFGVVVGVVTYVFVELLHHLKKTLEKRVSRLPIRMMLGGVVVVGMWKIVGTSDYLGLGVPTIVRSFSDAHLPYSAFAWKLVFTAVTLGAGFLGGEVTPLFFVGAALGNALGRVLGLPLDLAAGIGLAAVFGAAANTPFALSIMAVELLGANAFPHVVIVAVVAYVASGHRSIYPAQRVGRAKLANKPHEELPLRDWQAHDDDFVVESVRAMPAAAPSDVPSDVPSERTVADVMVPEVSSVGPDAPVRDVVEKLLREEAHGAVFVVEGGAPIGVVTSSDLVRRAGAPMQPELLATLGEPELHAELERMQANPLTARAVMTPRPIAVHATASLVEVATLLSQRPLGRLPVVDEQGALIGLVRPLDLLRSVAARFGRASSPPPEGEPDAPPAGPGDEGR